MLSPDTDPAAARALFDSWRETRDGFAPLFLEPVMRAALAHLGGALGPGARVLDLGSGSGHVASAVRACGGATICVEIDRPVLDASRRRYPGGAHVAARAERLPLADQSVDAVFCFSVLQYTDRSAALAEIRRVLRPSGRVVLVENLSGSPAAKLYRLWRRLARVRYPDRLTPLRHVSWRERPHLLARFPGARVDAFYLLSTCLLPWPAAYTADAAEPGRSLVRLGLRTAARLDEVLFRAAPPLRHAAWMMLLRG